MLIGVVTLITCKVTAKRCLGSITTLRLKAQLPVFGRNYNKLGEGKWIITIVN